MNIDVHSKVDKEDRPLTRADVEQLLHEVGSPDKLNLSGRNLEGVILAGLDLHGAHLHRVNLRDATLRGADLSHANLSHANLSHANLYGADLRGADISEAHFRGADLRGAHLSGANLSRAKGLYMESREAEETVSMLAIRINEEPLTAQNFTSIMSALTELHTKCWLISQDRFAELIEYTQTRNPHFVEEAGLVLTRMRQNSPLEVGFSNLDPKNIADALVTAIDGVTQTRQRLKKAELGNQEKAEQIEGGLRS